MNEPVVTPRLILRRFRQQDAEALFAMDSLPEVHRYLGNTPMRSLEQAHETIAMIMDQYEKNGIGRWAVIEKSSGDLAGWSGLKRITEPYSNGRVGFYDVGYRFAPRFWGLGYATESARAALGYGFTVMGLDEIIGTAHAMNTRSRRVLEKCGLSFVEQFYWRNILCDWLSVSRETWRQQQAL